MKWFFLQCFFLIFILENCREFYWLTKALIFFINSFLHESCAFCLLAGGQAMSMLIWLAFNTSPQQSKFFSFGLYLRLRKLDMDKKYSIKIYVSSPYNIVKLWARFQLNLKNNIRQANLLKPRAIFFAKRRVTMV